MNYFDGRKKKEKIAESSDSQISTLAELVDAMELDIDVLLDEAADELMNDPGDISVSMPMKKVPKIKKISERERSRSIIDFETSINGTMFFQKAASQKNVYTSKELEALEKNPGLMQKVKTVIRSILLDIRNHKLTVEDLIAEKLVVPIPLLGGIISKIVAKNAGKLLRSYGVRTEIRLVDLWRKMNGEEIEQTMIFSKLQIEKLDTSGSVIDLIQDIDQDDPDYPSAPTLPVEDHDEVVLEESFFEAPGEVKDEMSQIESRSPSVKYWNKQLIEVENDAEVFDIDPLPPIQEDDSDIFEVPGVERKEVNPLEKKVDDAAKRFWDEAVTQVDDEEELLVSGDILFEKEPIQTIEIPTSSQMDPRLRGVFEDPKNSIELPAPSYDYVLSGGNPFEVAYEDIEEMCDINELKKQLIVALYRFHERKKEVCGEKEDKLLLDVIKGIELNKISAVKFLLKRVKLLKEKILVLYGDKSGLPIMDDFLMRLAYISTFCETLIPLFEKGNGNNVDQKERAREMLMNKIDATFECHNGEVPLKDVQILAGIVENTFSIDFENPHCSAVWGKSGRMKKIIQCMEFMLQTDRFKESSDYFRKTEIGRKTMKSQLKKLISELPIK